MTFRTALAAVAVTDLAEAMVFYGRLFGRAADLEPMPSLAQWHLDSGGLQVVEQAENAGQTMATLLVDDFDTLLRDLWHRGIDVGEVIDAKMSRIIQVTDPAGNVITIGGN